MTDRIKISVSDGVADVRFNRPEKLNALDRIQLEAIVEAGEELAAAKHVRAVVLSGEGKGFCAGLDMSLFSSVDALGTLAERTHGNCNIFQKSVLTWRRIPAPVIAAVHGACIGGGVQYMSAADIRVVAPDTKLAIMEMRWGLIPDMGSYTTWRSFVRDDILRELTYTNRIFSGAEANELGFVTHLTENPLEKALSLANEIANKNPDAIKAAKRLINQLPDMDEDAILMMESVEQDKVVAGANQQEAVMAFLEKRAANFTDA